MNTETAEIRLKRLKMRSWRRGTKEMDLILGPFSDTRLTALASDALDLYERLLDENDQDLYLWFSRLAASPPQYTGLISVMGTANH